MSEINKDYCAISEMIKHALSSPFFRRKKARRKSCKKRKLEYIREKNKIRSGAKICKVLKINNSDVENQYVYENILLEAKTFSENLSKKFKTYITPKIRYGLTVDDFVNDRFTALIECRSNIYQELSFIQEVIKEIPFGNMTTKISQQSNNMDNEFVEKFTGIINS